MMIKLLRLQIIFCQYFEEFHHSTKCNKDLINDMENSKGHAFYQEAIGSQGREEIKPRDLQSLMGLEFNHRRTGSFEDKKLSSQSTDEDSYVQQPNGKPIKHSVYHQATLMYTSTHTDFRFQTQQLFSQQFMSLSCCFNKGLISCIIQFHMILLI